MKHKILKLSPVLGILFLFILNMSCGDLRIVDSSAEILSRSIDTTLNDSALIYGVVYDAITINLPISGADIWIEETDIKMSSDTLGNFSLKVPPGTYAIKCLKPYSDVMYTAVLDNIILLPNEKIEVRFFYGSMSE